MQTNDPTNSSETPETPETPPVEIFDTPQESSESSSLPESQPAPAAPSRFGRFMRDLLRVVAAVVILLALGLLAGYLLLARPLNQQVSALNAELTTANTNLSDAQASLESARLVNTRLENEKTTLQTDLTRTQAHVLLLQAFADVAAARMELALENPAGAKDALMETAATLQTLETSVPAENQGQVEALYTRLNLVDSELDTDPNLAATDLETLSNQLLELEEILFPAE